jgi:hypothetical protein
VKIAITLIAALLAGVGFVLQQHAAGTRSLTGTWPGEDSSGTNEKKGKKA